VVPATAVAFVTRFFEWFGLSSLPETFSENSKLEKGNVNAVSFKFIGISSQPRSMFLILVKHGKRLSFSQQAVLLLSSNLPCMKNRNCHKRCVHSQRRMQWHKSAERTRSRRREQWHEDKAGH